MPTEKRGIVPRPRTGFRKIVVGGEEWKWRYGSTIIAYDPSDKQHKVKSCVLLSVTPDEEDRSKYKKCRTHHITPSIIAEWIATLQKGT